MIERSHNDRTSTRLDLLSSQGWASIWLEEVYGLIWGIIARPKESAHEMKRLTLLWHTLEANGVKPRAYRFSAISYPCFSVFSFPPRLWNVFQFHIYAGHWKHARLKRKREGERRNKKWPCQNSWISEVAGEWKQGGLVVREMTCSTFNTKGKVVKVKQEQKTKCPLSRGTTAATVEGS